MHLASTDNPQVKRLIALHDSAGRRVAGQFLVEGRRAIDGFLSAGWQPIMLLVREDLELPAGWDEVTRTSARVAAKLSAAATASGYAAVFALPTQATLDLTAGGLVLVDVADPGNLGTLLRTAAAFGIQQVVLSGGADPYAAKVVQASAGALAALRLHRMATPEALVGAALCALVPRGGQSPMALSLGRRWLVVGGEAEGIPESWLAVCSERLTLPMSGPTESLNAAVAGAIGMWEMFVRTPSAS
ncbi:MAG: RNA methyltransferase [Planctomycetota bacterium]